MQQKYRKLIKLAIFINRPKTPSSRFRILQYIPYLEERGIKCITFCAPISKFGYSPVWMRGPIKRTFIRISQVLVYLPIRYLQIKTAFLENYDAIFIQKPLLDWPKSFFLEKEVWEKNKNIIFDIDDALYANTKGQEDETKKKQIEGIVNLSKLVICGNKNISNYLGLSWKKSIILSTTVDEKKFLPKKNKNVERICIGWTGTSSNLRYLLKLRPVFKYLSNKYDLKIKIISNLDFIKQLKTIKNIEFCKWNEKNEIKDLQEIDIGLMPLDDNIWTRGKCALKIIQYMALGIPAVASPVGENCNVLVDGETGYFAKNLKEWGLKIEKFICNAQLRERMGKNARERFEKYFSIGANIKKFVNALNSINYQS